tara:strand:- start:284 stop:919 length:636 start_codon:yes stop_codon:yes gene_type:complete
MLGVLIPALNEEKNIQKVIHGIQQAGVESQSIFVLNNNSTDRTKEIAIENKCSVIDIESRGYSSTLQAGLSLLRKKNYQRFLIVDGDNEIDSISVKEIIYKSGSYRLCCGFRKEPKRIGEKIVNIYFKKRFGISDYMCGLKLGYIDDYNSMSTLNYGIDLLNLDRIKNIDILNIEIKLNNRDGSRLGTNLKVNFLLIYNLVKYIWITKNLK